MKYYAHTREGEPEEHWQLLKDHLLQTAQIAFENCSISMCKPYSYLVGLVHDFGKLQKAFQLYLKNGGRRGSVPHASWGAAFIRKLGFSELAFVVDGHHKGLPNRSDLINSTDNIIDEQKDEFNRLISGFLEIVNLNKDEFQKNKIPFVDRLERELFIRYIYSLLVDADWLDTEEFCDPARVDGRISRTLDADQFISKLDAHIGTKPKEGKLNQLRNDVRKYAESKSSLSPGFFSMNLPTGMGKTLASISWALRHAKENDLKRIIVVLPYINIIDQTASIFKEIFGEEWVLEHHSGYNESQNETDADDGNTLEISKRLATENWDYPIIVTTSVQFFETLFGNRSSKSRKLHSIAESVVIFDEVQTLEKELVLPTLTMLKNVHAVMHTSFLFCTATQPAFEKREGFNGIDNIVPLVYNCDEIFAATRRVSFSAVYDYDEISEEYLTQLVVEQNVSSLCVFNTKKSALLFFRNAKPSVIWDHVYHLSTAMCPHHRKKTIASIRDDLKAKKKILVVSTQLIEAGVDFDFPCVFREYAPMESIIQAAGRCNREGLMSNYGKVFIFKLNDSGAPNTQYRSLAQHTIAMIEQNPEGLYGHTLFPEYYRTALGLFVDADKRKIDTARMNFDFETVAGSYRLIKDATESMFVQEYSDESRQLMSEINRVSDRGWKISRNQYRGMQQFSVQVYPDFLKKNSNHFTTLNDGTLVWIGKYDQETGIGDDPMTSDQLVI